MLVSTQHSPKKRLQKYLMRKINYEVLLLTLLGGVLYGLAHYINNWIFKLIEFSGHVNWIYLPAFLRLANVLVLGPVFGSVATTAGVCLICFFQNSLLSVTLLNTLASILGPLISFRVFKVFKGREVSISQIRDLITLAVIYSVMNALAHHIAWAIVEPDQFLSISQLPIMIFGDLMGALLGATLFSALVNQPGILSFVKKRADE